MSKTPSSVEDLPPLDRNKRSDVTQTDSDRQGGISLLNSKFKKQNSKFVEGKMIGELLETGSEPLERSFCAPNCLERFLVSEEGLGKEGENSGKFDQFPRILHYNSVPNEQKAENRTTQGGNDTIMWAFSFSSITLFCCFPHGAANHNIYSRKLGRCTE